MPRAVDRPAVALLLALSLGLLGLPSCDEQASSEADAVSILERMLASEESVSYRARKRMITPREAGRSRDWDRIVTHYAGGPTVFEREEGSGRPWVMERGRFYWLGDLDVLLSNYRVRLAGREEVEGRPAVTIAVESFHEGRPSMTFTVDDETGLLVRAVSRDWRGDVVMRSEMTDLEIEPDLPPPPEATRGRPRGEGGSLVPGGETGDLDFRPREPGWLPAGFVEKGRYVRTARSPRRRPGSADGPSLKTIYADGLTWIEVSQSAAGPEDGEEKVARKWTRGSRTTLRVVLDGVRVRLEGRLSPEILVRVLDSLADPAEN